MMQAWKIRRLIRRLDRLGRVAYWQVGQRMGFRVWVRTTNGLHGMNYGTARAFARAVEEGRA